MSAYPLAPETTNRRPVWIILAAVLGMAVTARMGWWQLDRAAQKEGLQAAMQLQATAPAVAAADLAGDMAAAAETRCWCSGAGFRATWRIERAWCRCPLRPVRSPSMGALPLGHLG